MIPFDALRPRGGPYFLLLQKVGKDRRKGVSPPCESPDQSGVLDAPLWKPPSLAALSGLAELLAALRLELRCRWGRPRARARSPRPPHLHRFGVGAGAPLPPKVPKRGKFADHARMRMVPRSKRLLRATPSQISRKLLPRKRPGVPSLPSRGCAAGTLARPQRGNPKGGAALFGQSLPTFCWPESRGPARPERVEGKK